MPLAHTIARLVEAGHDDLADQLVTVTAELSIEQHTNMAVQAIAYDVFDELHESMPDDCDSLKFGAKRKPFAAELAKQAEKLYRSNKKFAKQMRDIKVNEKLLKAQMHKWLLPMAKKIAPDCIK